MQQKVAAGYSREMYGGWGRLEGLMEAPQSTTERESIVYKGSP